MAWRAGRHVGSRSREDALVARDGGVDVADAVGEELGLAQRDARLVGRGRRGVLEAPQERRRLGVVLALDGVVDEVLEGLLVVAVLEDLQPRLARRFLVLRAGRVEVAACRRERDARRSVACSRSPRFGEELHELVPRLGDV